MRLTQSLHRLQHLEEEALVPQLGSTVERALEAWGQVNGPQGNMSGPAALPLDDGSTGQPAGSSAGAPPDGADGRAVVLKSSATNLAQIQGSELTQHKIC